MALGYRCTAVIAVCNCMRHCRTCCSFFNASNTRLDTRFRKTICPACASILLRFFFPCLVERIEANKKSQYFLRLCCQFFVETNLHTMSRSDSQSNSNHQKNETPTCRFAIASTRASAWYRFRMVGTPPNPEWEKFSVNLIQ
jgi:hypothetical protein